MFISPEVLKASETCPELSARLSTAASILNFPQNSVAAVLGMKDAVREILHIDTLYIPAPVSFLARKTDHGIVVDPL